MISLLKFLLFEVWPSVCLIGVIYLWTDAIIQAIKYIRANEKKVIDENSESV